MKNSGHSEHYRKQILDSPLHAFEEMVKADQSGKRPLYRDKNWQKEVRKDEKAYKRLNWYGNGGNDSNGVVYTYTTVLFVSVTKGGLLAKELRQREQEINKNSSTRMKIVIGKSALFAIQKHQKT